MVNELAEPSCPQLVWTTGFTNPSQQRCTRSWGFHTVRAGVVSGHNHIRARFVAVVYRYMEGFFPAMGSYTPRVPLVANPSQSAISEWGWGFHIVQGGIDPGDHRFRAQFVAVEDVWTDF